jgi:hypothetical protein
LSAGKLYSLHDGQFVANVNYKLLQHPAATNWWGELTIIEDVKFNEGDLFLIELEDGGKSRCHLKKLVNRAVSGLPPRYTYHITGLSSIE